MLKSQAENLWTADHELRMPGGVPFPTRMTVVKLTDGSLALISPIPIDDALAAALAALGPVRHLIAPNLFHHLHLRPAKARYPEARVIGPPALAKKEPGLDISPPDAANLTPFRGTLEAVTIEGAPRAAETVWLHVPSRTLVVTDLVFNVEAPAAWKTALLLWFSGTGRRLAQSRLWNVLVASKASASASCRRVLDLDFDRLIVAHGDVIVSGAKPRLAGALTRTG